MKKLLTILSIPVLFSCGSEPSDTSENSDFSVSQSLAFFKEGTLYSFVNLEDELGFVRIKPTYESN